MAQSKTTLVDEPQQKIMLEEPAKSMEQYKPPKVREKERKIMKD